VPARNRAFVIAAVLQDLPAGEFHYTVQVHRRFTFMEISSPAGTWVGEWSAALPLSDLEGEVASLLVAIDVAGKRTP
jgi:hypothetical protein